MARIIDYVDHINPMPDEMSYREPQQGGGDFRMGSVVTVQEHQAVVFISRGRIMDVLGPGQHILSTANIPGVANLVGMITNNRNPFKADLYFVNLKPFHDVRWGTNPPIELDTPEGMGKMFIMGNGVAELQIADPAVFMQYAIGKPVFRLDDFRSQIQTMLVGQLSAILSRQQIRSPQEANSLLDNLEGAVLAMLDEGFMRLGLRVTAFEANPFQRKAISTEEAAQLFGTWEQRMQLQQMDVARTAAGNEGMGGTLASAGLGFGLGQNLGAAMNPAMQQQQMMQQQMMMQQMQQMQQMMERMQQGNAPAQPGQPAAPAGGSGVPQTQQEVQAALDALEIRLMNGEISEDLYNRMAAKWQQRLQELGGNA
ncbi:MAG: SPFH domain-containing protein [Anaerolineae bacterium]|nr:SPFH domain-containing protein [Anaerolineae bacterium]